MEERSRSHLRSTLAAGLASCAVVSSSQADPAVGDWYAFAQSSPQAPMDPSIRPDPGLGIRLVCISRPLTSGELRFRRLVVQVQKDPSRDRLMALIRVLDAGGNITRFAEGPAEISRESVLVDGLATTWSVVSVASSSTSFHPSRVKFKIWLKADSLSPGRYVGTYQMEQLERPPELSQELITCDAL